MGWTIPEEAAAALRDMGVDPQAAVPEPLSGGMNAVATRLRCPTGESVVIKTGLSGDIWRVEAAGLNGLRVTGGPAIPEVLAVGEAFLLLQDFPAPVPEDGVFWENLARQLSALHSVHGAAFGYDSDNFLGTLPQRNDWNVDGWRFFAENRLLRYLDEPLCLQTLTSADRRGMERLCERLPDLVPAQPPSLLHGDIWRMNIVAADSQTPGVIDPAPYYAWAEVDVSMMAGCGGVPQRFFDAYCEARPLQEGWRERLELLNLREYLSGIAHFGDQYDTMKVIRMILAKFG